MTIQPDHVQYDCLPYGILERELITEPIFETLPHKPQEHNAHFERVPSTVQDYWLTLCTAILLGSLSFFFLSSAIFQFGHVLTMTTESQIEVPEQLTRQALSRIQ